jgi:catechol 2,3-dioxygenase-like lactoylglutathione lyase family enzyme
MRGRPHFTQPNPLETAVTASFDRSAEDLGNVVHLEHVNLSVPDQLTATQFYVSTLGLTRDPYMMTGVDNMWVNAGGTQFHLPTGAAQHFRGTINLVIPGRQALLDRLGGMAGPLGGTAFAFEPERDFIGVRCPWGNRLRCFESGTARSGVTALGIVELEFDVPEGCAEGIARFYRDILTAPATATAGTGGARFARVRVGAGQALVFRETAAELPPYDGHHIQIYVADFSGPHRRLQDLGLVSEESSRHQFRFVDIVDPQTRAPCFRIEHEVRSMTHPMFRRPLVNRNPQQSARGYSPGCDAFIVPPRAGYSSVSS